MVLILFESDYPNSNDAIRKYMNIELMSEIIVANGPLPNAGSNFSFSISNVIVSELKLVMTSVTAIADAITNPR